jgi:hypothetical protein
MAFGVPIYWPIGIKFLGVGAQHMLRHKVGGAPSAVI